MGGGHSDLSTSDYNKQLQQGQQASQNAYSSAMSNTGYNPFGSQFNWNGQQSFNPRGGGITGAFANLGGMLQQFMRNRPQPVQNFSTVMNSNPANFNSNPVQYVPYNQGTPMTGESLIPQVNAASGQPMSGNRKTK